MVLFDPTHIISMHDHISIDVEAQKIDSTCYLEKELIVLIFTKQ